MAAEEALTRDLSAEPAPYGIRVVGPRPQAVPETPTIREAYEPRAEATGLSWAECQERPAARTRATAADAGRAGRGGGVPGVGPGRAR
ncbi:hypothetical protein AB0D49_30965 [Streptomyces sp. NPDC048290]|uniref:hypothetical protein n=1 Tax=Streptomyces sp. NPDC048290 TaxID=3155811 RepID=UPI00341FFE8C